MARCLCCVVGLLCVWGIAVSGSDTPVAAPGEPAPVRIRRIVHPQPTPIVTAAAVPLPVANALPPQQADHLNPVQHLRRAAEHLEAAAVGQLADELCDRAAELRQTADRLERESAARLAELRQQLAGIQSEIRKLEQLAPDSEQVHVSIMMAEVNTALVEKLGLTFHDASEPQTNLIERLVSAANGPILPTVVPCESAESLIETLRRAGAATILSCPQIITRSGRPASINVGGEFPIPVPQRGGNMSVEWRQFGISAEVMPLILDNGRLKLDIAPEISERDFSKGVPVGGHLVPGITTRRINTQVEMDFGQTMLVGGMTSRTNGPTEAIGGVAVLDGVPVPGRDRVFKQIAHEHPPQERSLLILVTPKRVPRAEP
ncbi:MAG: hypothetical protein KF861_16890 [Planctomycetaceae bacterium]|nr:hypothetical protein [Planctomycetaceae bacterium]